MDKATYTFKNLESKYSGFLAPAFSITVGSEELDSSKVPITSLTVDIELGNSSGGCNFVVESLYDYENGKWAEGLLDTISVGKILEIKAGYTKKETVFYGYVDGFSIEYSSQSAPRLTVNGIDAKGFMMNSKTQLYKSEKDTTALVTKILNTCVSNEYAKSVTVGTIEEFKAQLIKSDMDDYRFLCFLAELYNFQFFIVNGEIIFDNMTSDSKELITMTVGLNLLSFSKSISLKSQVGKVIVYGIDPATKEPISGEASSTTIPGTSGKEAAETAPGFDSVVSTEQSMFVSTAEECTRLAQARLNAHAFDFVNGRGRCIGIPELIPGRYIRIDGIDKKSSDIYFITKVTHEYSSDQGYFTTFNVKGAKSG